MMEDFAVFICTHGRPDRQLTWNMLKSAGYTGKLYLVLDDTDTTIQRYIDNYGSDNVIVFDKNHYINSCDTGDNVGHYACILYAKNAVEDIARSFGLSAFLVVDDDITGLRYRYNDDGVIRSVRIKQDLDSVLDSYVEYMLSTNIACLGFAGCSVFFSGSSAFEGDRIQRYRYPYQICLRNTLYSVNWTSWYGEDTITLLLHGIRGQFWFFPPFIQYDTIMVGDTTKDGGMNEVYVNNSSFLLNFIKFRSCPTQLRMILYHGKFLASIVDKTAYPKLISGDYKKGV